MNTQNSHSSQNLDAPSNSSNSKTPLVGFYNAGVEIDEKKADCILWNDFRLGSKKAFSEIFLKYNPKLIAFGHALGFDKDITEDCIQELFLNLWRTRQELNEASSVKYYLVISLRRMLLRQKEKEQRTRKLLEDIRLEFPGFDSLETTDQASQKALFDKIHFHIEALPSRQNEALKLRYVQGKSYDHISQSMSISKVSVRKLIYKGMKTLRKNF